jgi:hypothetical protein
MAVHQTYRREQEDRMAVLRAWAKQEPQGEYGKADLRDRCFQSPESTADAVDQLDADLEMAELGAGVPYATVNPESGHMMVSFEDMMRDIHEEYSRTLGSEDASELAQTVLGCLGVPDELTGPIAEGIIMNPRLLESEKYVRDHVVAASMQEAHHYHIIDKECRSN